MNRQEVQSGINKTWDLADKLGLAAAFSNPNLLPLNIEFRDAILSAESTYIDVYLTAMNLSHHNIILSDYAYFQFSMERDGYVRYAYYPNPFISGTESETTSFRKLTELFENEFISHEQYLSLLDSKKNLNGKPMWRYENAPDQRKRFFHPCSHFHIGFHSENRWPLKRTLTPLAFSMLVFKQYYGEEWRLLGDDDDPEISNSFERALIRERQNCHVVSDDLFEKIEEQAFFFS
ncbi:hypothetical protein BFW88_18780 [Pseudomonas fluorescens]|nr:hypothetical protein BFW88_18780 [Pseudomonas fluorescens]OPB07211.1 hypothetical protein BFW92_18730 [Pseudomonas fluorescens]OPB18545.1 hypothetical protein BFW93_18755 [Pseudomonas fluorescens]